ncbi:hypothetical protein PCASD_10177 [Puccinia coronata f. sp. avenae]|uniref:DNA mismatch repair protein n=1 Tax=Puccinia coronata f. sp. avenae TaxID=200324 RepID=A0A2N5UGQ1_9BASI|nr:hypothetical protein PCASD_10177 [Puccinia coronata f. sp. avenae]
MGMVNKMTWTMFLLTRVAQQHAPRLLTTQPFPFARSLLYSTTTTATAAATNEEPKQTTQAQSKTIEEAKKLIQKKVAKAKASDAKKTEAEKAKKTEAEKAKKTNEAQSSKQKTEAKLSKKKKGDANTSKQKSQEATSTKQKAEEVQPDEQKIEVVIQPSKQKTEAIKPTNQRIEAVKPTQQKTEAAKPTTKPETEKLPSKPDASKNPTNAQDADKKAATTKNQQKTAQSLKDKANSTPHKTTKVSSLVTKAESSKSLEPLPIPKTVGGNKEKHVVTANCDLIQFDKFVTVGLPPSQNPSLYTKKIPKFILDSRLRFPDAILLTCVGSFYEAYFDQAIEVSELLNIKQAKYQFCGHAYPFSGFPIASLQKHLKTLVNEYNRVVAIAEQISDGEDLERRIVRIITPGTITDENLIDNESYNYLLGIHQNQLAWLDVSTGSYFHTTCEGGESGLMDEICRISPKEIIISADSSFRISPNSKAAKLSILITKIKNPGSSMSAPEELTAEKLIGMYIKQNLLPSRAATEPLCVDAFRYLRLDADAVDSLEITHTQNGKSTVGSLLSTISRTLTRPGKRLLRDRIMSPSRVLAEIQSRLDVVEKLVVNHISREDIQDTLKDIEGIDYVRLLQRFNLGQGTVQDLISMLRILKAIQAIRSTLSGSDIPYRFGCHLALEGRISDAIGDLNEVRDQTESEELSIDEAKDFFSPVVWNVRFNLNKELEAKHQRLKAAMEKGKHLQDQFRTNFDCKDLKLQVVPKLGAVMSINKARKSSKNLTSQLDKIKGQTLVDNGSRAVVAIPEWTKMHASIEKLRQDLLQEEQRVLRELFEQVASDHGSLSPSFQELAELDVAQSFATFAVDTKCVKPSINSKRSTAIVDGRHPIAEQALSSSVNGNFIPNSIVMHDNDGLVQIITGPNNGGKSTYLRQLAIIHILAQAGSFVPAEKAKLGVVHQIFTRFGSFDNVVLGKGTFLIEMEETCKILKSADEMSLVLMDEVGRGTGIEDGLSIAYGVLKYLMEKNRCRTLFSTHLPHVGSLLLSKDMTTTRSDINQNNLGGLEAADYLKIARLGFFCFGSSKIHQKTKKDSGGEDMLNFPYKIRRGLNPDSSGIDIARMGHQQGREA